MELLGCLRVLDATQLGLFSTKGVTVDAIDKAIAESRSCIERISVGESPQNYDEYRFACALEIAVAALRDVNHSALWKGGTGIPELAAKALADIERALEGEK